MDTGPILLLAAISLMMSAFTGQFRIVSVCLILGLSLYWAFEVR